MDAKYVKRGTQIVYIPDGETISYPDCEFGFIVRPAYLYDGKTVRGAFCRYWHTGTTRLRTVANSEFTSLENLQIFKSVSDIIIEATLRQLAGQYDNV